MKGCHAHIHLVGAWESRIKMKWVPKLAKHCYWDLNIKEVTKSGLKEGQLLSVNREIVVHVIPTFWLQLIKVLTFTAIPKPLTEKKKKKEKKNNNPWAWKTDKRLYETIYDISLMIYLKNLWTVESWLLGPRDTCSPFWNELLKRYSEIQKG